MPTTTRPIETVKAGDVILPPARELSLWMRRRCAEKGLPESALYLTVTQVEEGDPDRRGRWIVVRTLQTPEWRDGAGENRFSFKARPATRWPVIVDAAGERI